MTIEISPNLCGVHGAQPMLGDLELELLDTRKETYETRPMSRHEF